MHWKICSPGRANEFEEDRVKASVRALAIARENREAILFKPDGQVSLVIMSG